MTISRRAFAGSLLAGAAASLIPCGQKIGTVDEPVGRSASASLPGAWVGTTGRKGLPRLLDLL